MDESTKVEFPAAVEILRRLLEVQLERTGRLPEAVVTLGGTALSAHSIRVQTDDVDVYLSEIDDDALAIVQREGRQRYGVRFKIDATPLNTIWGDIAIRDIEKSPSVSTLSIGGRTAVVRALSVETLYVVKVSADRPKDRTDPPLIAPRTSFAKVVERANALFPSYGDRDGLPAFAERLARCIGRDFAVPLADVSAAFKLPDTVRAKMLEERAAQERSFLLALRAVMQRKPELITPHPEDRGILVFDAVAAGVPEEVREAMKDNVREVSDIAVTILKTHDVQRYVNWLRSRLGGTVEPSEPVVPSTFGR